MHPQVPPLDLIAILEFEDENVKETHAIILADSLLILKMAMVKVKEALLYKAPLVEEDKETDEGNFLL
ncbi:Glycine cleavage T-protein family [Perilla frutescens var. frutescens]|nr:Glycine cleavage T-protein family [Perilla frutescens var. frutescens]